MLRFLVELTHTNSSLSDFNGFNLIMKKYRGGPIAVGQQSGQVNFLGASTNMTRMSPSFSSFCSKVHRHSNW
jgi:hypothetical protein